MLSRTAAATLTFLFAGLTLPAELHAASIDLGDYGVNEFRAETVDHLEGPFEDTLTFRFEGDDPRLLVVEIRERTGSLSSVSGSELPFAHEEERNGYVARTAFEMPTPGQEFEIAVAGTASGEMSGAYVWTVVTLDSADVPEPTTALLLTLLLPLLGRPGRIR